MNAVAGAVFYVGCGGLTLYMMGLFDFIHMNILQRRYIDRALARYAPIKTAAPSEVVTRTELAVNIKTHYARMEGT